MITNSLKQVERLDKPNCLLYKAKIQAYLSESLTSNQWGSPFEEVVKEYPSFIDGYLQFWKYLKFRLTQLQR